LPYALRLAQLPAYDRWSATCDTLHGHTQVLGKLAVALAPPEPQLQHAALRLTARGVETNPLPAPDDSGAFVAALDLRSHEALVEHSDGRARRVALAPDRSVGAVARELLGAVRELAGPVAINPTPQEVPWSVPLDEDEEHASYDADLVASYFAAATHVSLVLAEFRAPYRGRSTPVNTWWGSFDLAVNLFSGLPADPPSEDFIMRNAMDAQEVRSAGGRAMRATAARRSTPTRIQRPRASLVRRSSPRRHAGRQSSASTCWTGTTSPPAPTRTGRRSRFAHSAFRHACVVCGWDAMLAGSAEGQPPPVV